MESSRVAELHAFDEQVRSSFFHERRTPVCPVEAAGGQGAMLRAPGINPDTTEKTSQACLPHLPVRVCTQTGGRDRQASCDATELLIAGFDEVGRGALAGPVVVGCVHFDALSDPGRLTGLDDSKRLAPKKREVLYERICALSEWGVGWVSNSMIDRYGIVSALTLAARRAYRAMGQRADLLLFDRGLSLQSASAFSEPQRYKELAFTKGDARSLHIAAASILAKVSRDRAMTRIHACFPGYDFDRNKGYGTAGHLAALRRLGPSSIHRRSFRLT